MPYIFHPKSILILLHCYKLISCAYCRIVFLFSLNIPPHLVYHKNVAGKYDFPLFSTFIIAKYQSEKSKDKKFHCFGLSVVIVMESHVKSTRMWLSKKGRVCGDLLHDGIFKQGLRGPAEKANHQSSTLSWKLLSVIQVGSNQKSDMKN